LNAVNTPPQATVHSVQPWLLHTAEESLRKHTWTGHIPHTTAHAHPMSKPLVHSRGLTKSAGACRVTPADHRATNAGKASRGRHARLYCMAAATATDPTGRRLHPAADARCSPPASSHVAPTTLPDTVVATQGACSRAREAPATTATAAASSQDQSSAARADDLRREMVPSPASASPRCHTSGAGWTERVPGERAVQDRGAGWRAQPTANCPSHHKLPQRTLPRRQAHSAGRTMQVSPYTWTHTSSASLTHASTSRREVPGTGVEKERHRVCGPHSDGMGERKKNQKAHTRRCAFGIRVIFCDGGAGRPCVPCPGPRLPLCGCAEPHTCVSLHD
jgi:hypothetical protein